ncbi:MAG TPA: nitrous oxide reductase accessory protein NosL, partial [Puia sp.]|nr:nitrous oxide reductase accessory protein NosL [Puia sp.]
YCKMMITDLRFCSEILTKKGRVLKFDDSHCLRSFIKSNEIVEPEIQEIYLTDFTGNHSFIKASEAFLLQSDSLNTPMNGNIAAFSSQQSLEEIMQKYPGKILKWNEIQK